MKPVRKRLLHHKEAHPHEKELGIDLTSDIRLGKRVLHLSMLPSATVYGTIQRIVRYSTGVEYWNVLSDSGMTINGPLSSFTLYENAPELKAGDRVSYRLDQGGRVQGTVIHAVWMEDHVRFLVHFDDERAFAVPASRLQNSNNRYRSHKKETPMKNEKLSSHEEPERHKRAAMTETITAYVQAEPSRDLFTLFLPSTQDLDLIKQAAAHSSLQTGKLIQVIYPAGQADHADEEQP